MQIKYGKRYKNKTSQYLLPCLLEGYDKIFSMKLKEMFILGCGLGDNSIINNPNFNFTDKRPIFILIDKISAKRKSEDFIYWVRYQLYFIKDYPMDLIGRAHMLILDFPEKYSNAYDKFLEGKYSEMFTKADIENMFSKDTEEYKILVRDKSLIPIFAEKLRKTFELKTLREEDLTEVELEFPYTVNQEDEFFNTGLSL